MRGTLEGCGLRLSLPGSAAEFVCPSKLVFEEVTEDELIEDEVAEGGVTEDAAAKGAGCFAADADCVILCSGFTITLLSCAFFNFHHSPPASSAQTTTRTNTSTMPG